MAAPILEMKNITKEFVSGGEKADRAGMTVGRGFVENLVSDRASRDGRTILDQGSHLSMEADVFDHSGIRCHATSS